ncbi:MAG TPA: hypothetical protein PLF81_08920 [Candidatus Anammoximicrobium sp.]|nr:hypothetical protein [Candidatus Anammoximicrobium sp.]
MNDPATNRPSRRRRWLLVLVLSPIVVGLIAVAVLGYGEYRSHREVTAEIARLRAAGEPVDNETLALWFQAGTSREGTAAWRDVLSAVEQVSSGETVNSFPIVGQGKLPEPLVPGAAWPDEPRIAEFLQEVGPLIAQIEQAGRYPAPVWQPIAFDGFSTLLPEIQASRGVTRLLHLEVLHALYHGDTERALRGFAGMQATAAAFDWDFCIVADLVGMALRGVHRDAIRKSLADIHWDAPQLDQLLAQVQKPRDVAARWRRICASERAMALAMLQGSRDDLDGMLPSENSPHVPALLLFPSGMKKYLDTLAAFQQIGEPGVLGILDRARTLEHESVPPDTRRFDELVIRLLLPAMSALAGAYERDELDRRLTRTALGVKRYRESEGRWPARLSDLAAVGLEPQDWTALQAGPFGYKIEGEDAVVWAYDAHDPGSPSRIRSEPPGEKDVSSAGLLWHVTRIGQGRRVTPE